MTEIGEICEPARARAGRSGGRQARVAMRAAPLADDVRPVRAGMPGGQYKPLSEEGRFYHVATIVLFTKGFHFADIAMVPVCPRALKSRNTSQVIHNTVEAFFSFALADKAPLHTDNQTHQAESTTAYSDHIAVILWIFSIDMNTLASKSCNGLGALPEILESLALNLRQQ